MIVDDERDLVRTVAERWAAQYGSKNHFSDKRTITKQLESLDVETATAEDVEKVMGNASWCGPYSCDECGTKTRRTVMIGQPLDYESATARVCIDCLKKAVALIEEKFPE